MDEKYATRDEILERNPQLSKHWFTRFMAGPIIMGALIDRHGWRRFRWALIAGPVVIVVFVVNIFITVDMSAGKKLLHLFLITYLTLCLPLMFAAAYGYKYKSELDTTGGVKTRVFNNLGRYAILYALIGAGISSGIGIFGWLK